MGTTKPRYMMLGNSASGADVSQLRRHPKADVLSHVANVLGVGTDDRGKASLQCFDNGARVVNAESSLSYEGELFGIGYTETGYLLGTRDQVHPAVDASHRADDFGMPGMPNQDY